MAITVSDAIRYIGVDDLTIDLFESQYRVPEGISYNSYLILDEKTCLMDTVDKRGTAEWESNLKEALGDRSLDYLVIQHMEPDHAGSVQRVLELYPDVKLVGNAKTFQMLPQFLQTAPSNDQVVVKEGDSLELGSHTLTFYMAPMVHWPEVMVSYESTEKILFSADGFGTFGANCKHGIEDWKLEAARYYFNIVGKYGAPVQTLLKKASGLAIETICPLHGPVLKGDLTPYIQAYDTWSKYEPQEKAILVACASIHGNTKAAAMRIAEELQACGQKVTFMDLCREDMSHAVELAFLYDRTVLCASTYDGGLFLPMHDFLSHLAAKTWQNRKVAIVENGSWAAQAGKVMRAMLEEMKNIEVCEETLTIKSTLHEADEPQLKALVAAIANV